MVPINFTARYIGPVSVLKKDENKYTPTVASFVEFKPTDFNDLITLSCVARSWDRSYASNIYGNAYQKMHAMYGDDSCYYGVVLPQDSYEKVDKKNVLGLVQYTPTENYANIIDFLQVNPKTMHKSGFAKKMSDMMSSVKKMFALNTSSIEYSGYKGIGTGIINTLKEMSKDKPIMLVSDKKAVEFYEKNDFIKIEIIGENGYIWKPLSERE